MNFNKFGKTANLFDKDNATVYDCYITSNGQWDTGAGNKTVRIPCDSNTQYTLSTASTYSAFRIMETNSDNIPSDGSPVSGTLIYYGSGNAYTFTTSNTAKYIIFQSNAALLSQWLSELMFNLGSTPLPYEPYGNTWHDIPHYIHNTDTDTITTPADIYANSTTATVGLKGNTVQNGTPTPTTPIMPQGTGDETANLFYSSNNQTAGSTLHITQTIGNSNFILNKNESQTDTSANIDIDVTLPVGTYTLSVTGLNLYNNDYDRVFLRDDSSAIVVQNVQVNRPKSFRLTKTTHIHRATVVAAAQSTYNNTTITIMLNVGSTPLPYEPYGIKIPILNNSQATNVYLGEVQTTRKIKKLVLTGGDDENWNITNNSKVLYLAVSDFLKEQGRICYCTHYETVNNVSSADDVNDGDCTFNDHLNWLYIKDSNYTSAQGFKSYLAAQYTAGTPVCVWYVLATPTTGIFNEPLRKIGDYADFVSGITIPTIAGANTLSVDTTLQPSEVTVNYKGWHPVQSVHERENGQWD